MVEDIVDIDNTQDNVYVQALINERDTLRGQVKQLWELVTQQRDEIDSLVNLVAAKNSKQTLLSSGEHLASKEALKSKLGTDAAYDLGSGDESVGTGFSSLLDDLHLARKQSQASLTGETTQWESSCASLYLSPSTKGSNTTLESIPEEAVKPDVTVTPRPSSLSVHARSLSLDDRRNSLAIYGTSDEEYDYEAFNDSATDLAVKDVSIDSPVEVDHSSQPEELPVAEALISIKARAQAEVQSIPAALDPSQAKNLAKGSPVLPTRKFSLPTNIGNLQKYLKENENYLRVKVMFTEASEFNGSQRCVVLGIYTREGLSWYVQKDYAKFQALHSKLKASLEKPFMKKIGKLFTSNAFKCDVMPGESLPAPRMAKNTDFIQHYMDSLLKNARSRPETLYAFLSSDILNRYWDHDVLSLEPPVNAFATMEGYLTTFIPRKSVLRPEKWLKQYVVLFYDYLMCFESRDAAVRCFKTNYSKFPMNIAEACDQMSKIILSGRAHEIKNAPNFMMPIKHSKINIIKQDNAEQTAAHPNSFRIMNSKASEVFYCESKAARDMWVQNIARRVQEMDA